jgi:cysteine desulfurase
MSKHIYLDNCLTTRLDHMVLEAMLPYLTDRFYLPGNFIKTGATAKNDISAFKSVIADSLYAKPSEIHFTPSGTIANNIAIKGYILANAGRGNHIICSFVDYPDILTNVAFFEESGFMVTYLSANAEGFIDLDELSRSIRKDTILVMTTFANHVLGTIQPIAKIREIIQGKNPDTALFVDASQAFGRLSINPVEMGIDMLSISAHKINGPQGAGALYVREGLSLAQIQHGISRVDDYATGGTSMASLAGMAKAVEIQFSDLSSHISRMRELQVRLLTGIQSRLEHVSLNGPPIGEHRICHNLNVSIEDVEGEAIMMMMDMAGITIATGSACASQGLKPNYVMMAVGKSFTQSHGSMKFTFSRLTTADEIDYTTEKFCEIVMKLRKYSPLHE